MNRKTRALKGLMTLCIVIALCMFFSRTVQTITTPKIQRISATKGKLEQKISLTGSIYFPETEAVRIDAARKLAITIDEIMVKPGHYVQAGDVIFTAYAPEYESKYNELKASYEEKVTAYADKVAAHLRIRQESPQNNLYNTMLETMETYYTLRYRLLLQAESEGYVLPEDEAQWRSLTGGTDTLNTLSAQLLEAGDAMDAAVQELSDLYNGKHTTYYRIGDSTFEYIKEKEKLEREIDVLSQELMALENLHASLTTVTAPHSGYIASIDLKAGDAYDGSKAAFAMTEENAVPTLRADITDVSKTLREGLKAILTDSDTESTVQSLETAADGKKYALIKLDSKVLKSAGGLTHLLSAESIPLSITYKAQKSTTLLPSSAVRTDSDGTYYVYVVQQSYGSLLSSGGYTIAKTPVTVLEKSDQVTALSEDLSYREIADREDRALTDGQAVMDYVD